jgi:hexosaminidase
LHGLETLLQLLQNNSTSFPIVEISDAPRFTWRGLMIDAARHFQPVDVIKRNLDAMASMKMNVFIGI